MHIPMTLVIPCYSQNVSLKSLTRINHDSKNVIGYLNKVITYGRANVVRIVPVRHSSSIGRLLLHIAHRVVGGWIASIGGR